MGHLNSCSRRLGRRRSLGIILFLVLAVVAASLAWRYLRWDSGLVASFKQVDHFARGDAFAASFLGEPGIQACVAGRYGPLGQNAYAGGPGEFACYRAAFPPLRRLLSVRGKTMTLWNDRYEQIMTLDISELGLLGQWEFGKVVGVVEDRAWVELAGTVEHRQGFWPAALLEIIPVEDSPETKVYELEKYACAAVDPAKRIAYILRDDPDPHIDLFDLDTQKVTSSMKAPREVAWYQAQHDSFSDRLVLTGMQGKQFITYVFDLGTGTAGKLGRLGVPRLGREGWVYGSDKSRFVRVNLLSCETQVLWNPLYPFARVRAAGHLIGTDPSFYVYDYEVWFLSGRREMRRVLVDLEKREYRDSTQLAFTRTQVELIDGRGGRRTN